MTLDQWLDRMRAEGFSFRCLTQARETGQRKTDLPAIDNWTIYGPDGDLLTSCITRQVFDHRTGKPDGLFIFWISESMQITDDLEHLRALDAKAKERRTGAA